MIKKLPNYIFALAGMIVVTSCHQTRHKNQLPVSGITSQHSAYDDSTLSGNRLPVLMPYNRIIDPAGSVIYWGDGNLENHSLDVKTIDGTDLLAVEDRFGIAVIDSRQQKVLDRFGYSDNRKFKGLMSTYSGIQVLQNGSEINLFWSAANADNHTSYVIQAVWNGQKISIKNQFSFKPQGNSPLALPNGLAINRESGIDYLYVVLNGNNTLDKIAIDQQKTIWSKPAGVAPYGVTIANNCAYVSNWGGPIPTDSLHETAGVPYGQAYINPKTGATSRGTLSVFDLASGAAKNEIEVGQHPNDIIHSADGRFVYVANGNSDNVMAIDTRSNSVTEQIPVKLDAGKMGFIGDTPNALALSDDGSTLYVANGMDNAVAIIKLGAKTVKTGSGKSTISGFIPTEAYPGGLAIKGNTLFVSNLEGEGARVNSKTVAHQGKSDDAPDIKQGAYNSHKQMATLSIIPLPTDDAQLAAYTAKVHQLSLDFRTKLARLMPRKNVTPQPVPERIGEPSVFKHVIYIIKENRTYDQVLGDVTAGNGAPGLCVFGNTVTPNQHQLVNNFLLMDNYYVSGKSSAEGHQWADAGMVNDYVEKSVRAWFRSYPHVQTDAMVYDKNGFIWNNAADHQKSVRIYGEACIPEFARGTTWTQFYNGYQTGKPLPFKNVSTISRVRPMLSPSYPGYDNHEINDQIRASAFINELDEYSKKDGDQWPELMILALPADHTGGTKVGLPKPRAMVADNDLALGRIVEKVSKSRFWKNTVIFVTEDDSQAGWDHVSAYRSVGMVISPYSRLQQTVHTNYNQTCIVRTIEQILGIPPMNAIDATALPMFNCFTNRPDYFTYTTLPNQIPLNEMNPNMASLKGKDLYYARLSALPEFNHIDGGRDDIMNRIIWHAAKKNKPYPVKLAGKADDDKD